MITKLYRKLYLYAIVILVTSIILTGSVMALLFQSNQRNIFREHFLMEARFIKKALRETYHNQPKDFKTKIKELSNQLNWNITYWKGDTYIYYTGKKPISLNQNVLDKIDKNKEIIFQKNDFPFELVYYIDENYTRIHSNESR